MAAKGITVDAATGKPAKGEGKGKGKPAIQTNQTWVNDGTGGN